MPGKISCVPRASMISLRRPVVTTYRWNTCSAPLLVCGSTRPELLSAAVYRAEILRRIEAERRGAAEGAEPLAVQRRAVRLRHVFDQRKVVRTAEGNDRI